MKPLSVTADIPRPWREVPGMVRMMILEAFYPLLIVVSSPFWSYQPPRNVCHYQSLMCDNHYQHLCEQIIKMTVWEYREVHGRGKCDSSR
jgi:hypothetical protein